MKKRIIWLVLSCMVVLSLVLSSCAPKAEPTPASTPIPSPTLTTTPTPTPTSAPPGKEMVKDSLGRLVEKPKYGGKFIGVTALPPMTFDYAYGSGWQGFTLHLTNENLLTGDWKRGPTGTGETPFLLNVYLPKFEIGCLAESWEVPDANTIVLHIRKGVHFHDKPPVNGREMTAEDVAFTIRRHYDGGIPMAYGYRGYPGWFESATVTDKYTVVLKVHDSEKSRTADVFQGLTKHIKIVPPEAIKQFGDLRDWRNAVGTGPFTLTNAVMGSSYTLDRNPNYWRHDPLHPDNQLPYLDKIVWLEVAEESTRLAALRTNRVDWLGIYSAVPMDQGEDLIRDNPKLKYVEVPRTNCWALFMRVDKPELPFYDVRVRRALEMAIDKQAILRDYYQGHADLISLIVPSSFGDAFTPYEKLPPSTKELFEYHPDKAKQLLAEAGYPKGFKTKIISHTASEPVDLLSIVKEYWSKIGVDLEIQLKEVSVWKSIQYSRNVEEWMFYDQSIGTAPKLQPTSPADPINIGHVDDPYVNERRAAIWAWENMGKEAKINQLLKEAALRELDQVYYIQLPNPHLYTMWQLWLKSYSGENIVGYANLYNFVIYIWLDEELKREMAGRR